MSGPSPLPPKPHNVEVPSWGSKFKLECLEVKNSYLLLIDIINFKLPLINFEYSFVEKAATLCFGIAKALDQNVRD